jgi:sugar phosphate isomerase/epimerase
MLSITTDYVRDTGCPGPYLRDIADAGFTHVHWCHHWNTDFLYSNSEIDRISTWLATYGLRVLDIHASHGREKAWASPYEYARLAGIELVKNRIAMAAALGSDVIILHLPPSTEPRVESAAAVDPWLTQVCRSLDALAPFARERCVRIGLENMGCDDFVRLRQLFSLYGAEFLGLCYDAGHGNLGGQGLIHLAHLKGRLISVHLHDNDGSGDQHKPVFSGTIDWDRLARVIAASAYKKCVSMEVSIQSSGFDDEAAFLEHVHETGTVLSAMIGSSS